MATHEDFDMSNADLGRLNKTIADATEKERARCLAIVAALKSDDEIWETEFDGCDGPDLVNAACDELTRRINEGVKP